MRTDERELTRTIFRRKLPAVAQRKKNMTAGQMRQFIHSLRGKYKHLPLMETLWAVKREEKEIKIHRLQ